MANWDQEAVALGERLGWAYRDKLTPVGRLLLTAWLGPKYPAPSSTIGQIAAWQAAAAAEPDLPEAWFMLGDRQLHDGRTNDLPHPVEQARTSFRRALELAPSWVLPLDHLILTQLDLDDTVGLRALATRWLAQDTIRGTARTTCAGAWASPWAIPPRSRAPPRGSTAGATRSCSGWRAWARPRGWVWPTSSARSARSSAVRWPGPSYGTRGFAGEIGCSIPAAPSRRRR